MTISREDLGQRIARARERTEVSQAELAQALGFHQSAMSRIESGERGVDSLELAAIAEVLEVSVLDLLETRPMAEELRLAARQQGLADSAALQQAIDRVVDLARFDELLRELHRADQIQQQVPSHRSDGRLAIEQGRNLAIAVRADWCLDDDPLPDLFGLIEDRAGVYVLLEPLSEGLDGLSAWIDESVVLLVDSSPMLGRQRFTAAHELCHVLLGDGGPLVIDEKVFRGQEPAEIRANAFAAHFLMPAEGLDRYIASREIDGEVATELQYTFGVSLDALLWHLLNLAKIDETRRTELARSGAKSLAYRHGFGPEWEQIEGQRGIRRPPHRLFRRALDAYEQGLIGIEPVADLLGHRDPETLRLELEEYGILHDTRWWEETAPA